MVRWFWFVCLLIALVGWSIIEGTVWLLGRIF